jgi:hypothetical protein
LHTGKIISSNEIPSELENKQMADDWLNAWKE